MAEHVQIKKGARVRLDHPSPVLRLTSNLGKIVEKEVWDDAYIVELDEPAYLRHADGVEERVDHVRELARNLTVIQADSQHRGNGTA